MDFYKSHYRPDGATLIAVGDITAEELAKELEKAFADWKKPEPSGAEHSASLRYAAQAHADHPHRQARRGAIGDFRRRSSARSGNRPTTMRST